MAALRTGYIKVRIATSCWDERKILNSSKKREHDFRSAGRALTIENMEGVRHFLSLRFSAAFIGHWGTDRRLY